MGYVEHTSPGPFRYSDLEARPVPLLSSEDREDIGNLVLKVVPEAWILPLHPSRNSSGNRRHGGSKNGQLGNGTTGMPYSVSTSR